MERFLISLTFILYSFSVFSQELVVKSFQLNNMDLSARIEKRLDSNGNQCALIKVEAIPTCEFGGYIIGSVEKKLGAYWVYVCTQNPTTRKLIVSSEKFQPLEVEFSQFGITSIEPGATYTLRIEAIDQADKNVLNGQEEQPKEILKAKNLDIVVRGKTGKMLYFTFDKYKSLTLDERNQLEVVGIYFSEKEQSFILNCKDSFPKKYTFEEAVKKYKVDLPTKIQMEVISKNYDYLKRVLPLIGDDGMRIHYWTSTKECDKVSTKVYYECRLYMGVFGESGYVSYIGASPELKKGWKFKAWVRTVQNL